MVKPLSSYPQEFFSIWEQALSFNLHLELESKGQATNLKHRLYAFRKRLSEQNLKPEYYTIDLKVEGTILSSYIPAWKKQIRALDDKALADLIEKTKLAGSKEEEEEKGEALSSTLANLGFTADDGVKN
jgi:hypothetical protein